MAAFQFWLKARSVSHKPVIIMPDRPLSLPVMPISSVIWQMEQ